MDDTFLIPTISGTIGEPGQMCSFFKHPGQFHSTYLRKQCFIFPVSTLRVGDGSGKSSHLYSQLFAESPTLAVYHGLG